MSVVELSIVCATVLLLAGVAASVRGPRRTASVFEGVVLGDDVTAYLRDGQAVRGIVQDVRPERLSLTGAKLLTRGQDPLHLGRILVPEESCELVQVLEREAVVSIDSAPSVAGKREYRA